MSKEPAKKVGFEASEALVDGVQNGYRAGRMYNGKRFCNRLAYEIGAKILLEIPDEEEEAEIDRQLSDLSIEEAFINSKKNTLLDKKEKIKAKQKKKEEDVLKSQQEIDDLALKIIEYWDPIVVFKKKEPINYILNKFPGKLSREKVSSVFPNTSDEPIPTHDEALLIASSLLSGECYE